MRFFEEIGQASVAINQWFWSNRARLPERVVERVEPLLGVGLSPVDAATKTAHIIYANRADLEAEDLEFGASLSFLCAEKGYHGFGTENLGMRMSDALRRDSGEVKDVGEWPEAETDPEALAEYAPPGAVSAEATPPAPAEPVE